MIRLRALPLTVATLATAIMTSSCIPGFSNDESMTVTAYFSDSAGLFVGNDVGILGVTVGRITDIEPDGTQVKVTMEIEGEREVPADAGAVVVARSVATDRYVELTPVYDSGPTLQSGAEIPVANTRTPVDFDDVLEALNTFAVGIAGTAESRDAIRRIIDSGAAALDGRGELVQSTITDLSGAVSDVTGQREDISATVRALDALVAVLASNDTTVRDFVDQVTEASDLLADERENFRTALRGVEEAVMTVAEYAVEHRQEIIGLIDESSAVMRTILSRERDLTEILEVMPLAMQNLIRAGAGERLPVRVPPSVLLPLGDEIGRLCDTLPLDLCDLISGTEPGDPASPRSRGSR
ncbi:MAG: MCE family protein [Nocardioides sp.]